MRVSLAFLRCFGAVMLLCSVVLLFLYLSSHNTLFPVSFLQFLHTQCAFFCIVVSVVIFVYVFCRVVLLLLQVFCGLYCFLRVPLAVGNVRLSLCVLPLLCLLFFSLFFD